MTLEIWNRTMGWYDLLEEVQEQDEIMDLNDYQYMKEVLG